MSILYYSRAHKRPIRMSKIELARKLGGLDIIGRDPWTAFRVDRWSKRSVNGFRHKKTLPIHAYLGETPSHAERRMRMTQRRSAS